MFVLIIVIFHQVTVVWACAVGVQRMTCLYITHTCR